MLWGFPEGASKRIQGVGFRGFLGSGYRVEALGCRVKGQVQDIVSEDLFFLGSRFGL